MANDYYGSRMDDGFNMWGEKIENDREVYEMGKSGDPRKRDKQIVAIGEKSIAVLDGAEMYRSHNKGVLPIIGRDACTVCGRTLTVRCPNGVFADFFTAHMKCNREYFEKNGCPPKGVGAMEVGNTLVFGRVELLHELMEATPPEMLGDVKHTFS